MTKRIELEGGARQGGKTHRMLEFLQEVLKIKAVATLPCIDVAHARNLIKRLESFKCFKWQVNARRPLGAHTFGKYRKRSVYILVSSL